MHDWTFVSELCGGTYISQYEGANVADAIETWTMNELQNVLNLASNNAPRNYEVEVDKLYEATPLYGLSQVYFWTFSLSYKRLWLLLN